MLGLIESLVAISAIIITCRIAGRIPAMMVTAVAAASAAIIMPPFASWEVESTADVLTVVIQTIIGLAVVYKWPSKKGSRAASKEGRSLKSGGGQRIQFLDQHHPGKRCALAFPYSAEEGSVQPVHDVTGKVPIEVLAELDQIIGVSQDELERILSDVMQLALADLRTQRLKIYTGRRPSLDQISIVAEYDSSPSLPRVRILDRSDSQSAIGIKEWPATCSASSFDDRFGKTYIISIRRSF